MLSMSVDDLLEYKTNSTAKPLKQLIAQTPSQSQPTIHPTSTNPQPLANMPLIDHTCLPVPHALLEAELAFLLAALAPLGIRQLNRPVDTVIGLGRATSSGQVVEDDGTNNACLYLFSDEAPSRGKLNGEDGLKGGWGVHVGLKASSKC
jgi:hypothetical protein